MRKILTLLALLGAVSCARNKAQDYLDFLYESMPLPDSLTHSSLYWEENVAKTLEVREKMGWNIPEREFRHFVLPLRVNNEDLDDFRLDYADTLCSRVKGMDIARAALEINHWCHEQATYVPSDGRTLGPEALIRSGLGRCGEESVLAVSALRAAGIPARQVYTPRWAHTDDNHAWVEVWTGDGWHFMGACEPESVLDLAWFNAPVSRAMLLHTKAFGDYQGPEDVISRTSAYTEINVTKGYIPTTRTTVKVVDEKGATVEGAAIEFRIYNYAEFYCVARYLSDASGCASLDTGIGDMVIWARKGDRLGIGVARGEDNTIVLDKTVGERYSFDLDIVPPVEKALPDNSTEKQKAENSLRLAREDSIRLAHPHPKADTEGLFLSAKDRIDVSEEVLEEAREFKGEDRYVCSERIGREKLLPYRREILSSGISDSLATPSDVVRWVLDSIKLDESRNPQGLSIPPAAVWRGRIADKAARDMFFVALCRTLGFPSRLGFSGGGPQYRDGDDWITVDFGRGKEELRPKGNLHLIWNPDPLHPVKEPHQERHWSLSRIDGISPEQCWCHRNVLEDEGEELEAGYHMLVSGMRMADGSVLAHIEMFNLPAGQTTEIPLILRYSIEKPQVIGNMDAERKWLPEGAQEEVSILSSTGRGYFLLCLLGGTDEPSIHAKGDLGQISAALNDWGRPILIMGTDSPESLEHAQRGSDPDSKVYDMLASGMDVKTPPLPLIALCDSFGRIVYFSQGYNTSLGEQLSAAIAAIE